ncbi:hypothetical protein [Chroococcidiopsis thermalis]|uniref:Uncharacterized protein n=1 Tax=Chroococcidiopsis thermalis (strain PCC 7203) TaxID=251229 RepID=K9U9L7_CHRTP|nr:hypothetical protein [Chroococcidiopsis thermalis]AFY91136.1 hypothetical protein Chro_5797 [Chroococcidiopsis thermalis PCC 7203]
MPRKTLRQDFIELAVMRKRDSDDGIVISYLQNHRRPQTELACEALRAHYLPLALLDAGLSGKKLREVAIDAIAQLEAQIGKIERMCDLEKMARVLVQPPTERPTAKGNIDVAASPQQVSSARRADARRDADGTATSEEPDEDEEAQEELPHDEVWDAMLQLRLE